MKHSESISNFAEAFVKFQAEITDPKLDASTDYVTKTGKKINFKYASLPEILKTVRPVLTKNGISIIQEPKTENNTVKITTILIHKSGEWVEFEPIEMKAASALAQEIGSAITYGRRYNISSVLGLGSEDDDDGNAAQDGVDDKSRIEEPPQHVQYDYATEKQVGMIKSMLAKSNVPIEKILERYHAANLESLSKEQASNCITILKKQIGE